MNQNGVLISQKKLTQLVSVLPADVLREEYTVGGLSDIEIAARYGLSQSWVTKLRKFHGVETDPHYQLRRNKLRSLSLSDRQQEVLFGSLFGDSCIAVQASGQGYWSCRHSIAQEEYLLKMAAIMEPFTAKVFYGERAFKKGGKMFPYVDARTHTHPYFTELRKLFYPNGVKSIRSELLEKLTPAGFAFWFLDDGSTTGHGFDITTFDPFFRNPLAKDIFRDVLGLSVSITWSAVGEGNIHVLKESHDVAWEYIRPEMLSCLSHKIPQRYRIRDNQQPSLGGNPQEGSTTEESLKPFWGHGGNSCLDGVTCPGTPGAHN